jgi:signal transduction histidine kinase
VLQVAFLAAGVLLAYQATVTLLQPEWVGPATAWVQAVLAWSGLITVALVSRYFVHAQHRAAGSWWAVSAALLCYAVARTVWLVEQQVLVPNPGAQPSWPDLFFLLQYPCFVLGLLLVPRVRPGFQTTLVVLDGCLLLGAAVALSWYFLLAPIYAASHETLLGKWVNLGYPLGDLAIFVGLTLILLRYRHYELDHRAMALLVVAFVFLFIADSWFATIMLSAAAYRSGSGPDLFWMAFYLLVPLAALLHWRCTQRTLAGATLGPRRQQPRDLRRQDLLAGLRVATPVAAAVLASTLLFIKADLVVDPFHPVVPPLIALSLLGLALLRQGLTAVENERLRREREDALRATTVQMEAFLGEAGHELRNPLTGLVFGLQLIESRIRRLLQRDQIGISDVAPLLDPIEQSERQEERMERLVSDLVDVARVRAGKLDLQLAPTNLSVIVRHAVEEQRQVNPQRTLSLIGPEAQDVPVMADAHRVGQVVTNYLTNALKYSPATSPVDVGLHTDAQQARVWVRDKGPGLPAKEHERIWDRFYRTPGVEVQSGTGVGLGLGLHICRSIVEGHHGQVGVDSAPGRGSTFWFTVPLTHPREAIDSSNRQIGRENVPS